MAGIWAWFAAIFMPWLQKLLFRLWDDHLSIVGALFSYYRLAWFLICAFLAATAWAIAEITVVLNDLDLTELQTPTMTMIYYYKFMNRFLPLHEAAAGAVIIFEIWLGITVLRWIKSFVPTLSN